MHINLDQISHNIRFFRDQNKWTQKELAEKIMTSRSVITKWENNIVLPDIASLLKLSSVFSVTLDHLAGNYSFRDDLLKDFKRIYASKSKPFDEDVVDLVEYIMKNPDFKEEIYRLKKLPIQKQKSVHELLSHMIDLL